MRRILLALSILVFLRPTLSGQSTIHPLTTILEVEPVGSGIGLGAGVLGLGDINNDGKPDFAVSAGNIKKTFIYFGGQAVLDSAPDVIIKGGGPMARGDLNGDGRMDLVVATRETLLVYYGKTPSPIALDTVPDLIITGEGVTDGFANSFAVGDLDHDGFDDLAVAHSTFRGAGKVYVYLGRTNPSSMYDYSAVGDTLTSGYGWNIRVADVNGDGIADLAISSDDYTRGFQAIDIFYGRSGWTFSKDRYNQRLDSRKLGLNNLSWFNLVDVNGDGKADISFNWDRREYFLYGRSDSISTTPDLVLTNPDTNFYTGLYGPAVNIGDINYDGVRDFVLRGTQGGPAMCLIVYLGSSNRTPVPAAGRCRGFVDIGSAFQNVTDVGDVNGDGVNDFAACVPLNPLSSPQDGYFVVLSGDKTLTSVSEERTAAWNVERLSQNYPNPFNLQTNIQYTVPKRGAVVLIIYDSLGREVRRLVNEGKDPGTYTVVWGGNTVSGNVSSSGVYYYQLIVDGVTIGAKKLVLLK